MSIPGDNVVDPSEHMPWYNGPTLMHVLEKRAHRWRPELTGVTSGFGAVGQPTQSISVALPDRWPRAPFDWRSHPGHAFWQDHHHQSNWSRWPR